METAVTRFKRGQCPGCGKGLGEPRGLEYRPKLGDLYCHSCKRAWPNQVDLDYLQDQLKLMAVRPDAGVGRRDGAPGRVQGGDPVPLRPGEEPAPPPVTRALIGLLGWFSGRLRRH